MVETGVEDEATARKIANEIACMDSEGPMGVEEIQDIVERKLMASRHKDVARNYVRYRYRREASRGF